MRLLILICLFFSLFAINQAQARTLSLQDAILLSLRENPNVQQAQLNLIIQKYALDVAQWQFQPHYALTAAKNSSRSVISGIEQTSQSWGVQPVVSLLTPVGTQLALTSTNNVTSHYNPSLTLQVVQPLIRGFGRPVVEAALYNAMDSERISRLNVVNALRTTITAVINAYLDVVSAQHTIEIDKAALQRAEKSVEQTKLFIKAGRKAGVELVTVQADVANAKTKLENDQNTLNQMRYALLTAIGVDPNLDVDFSSLDVPALTKRYSIPSLEETKRLTLENDIQFQVDQITLYGSTKRNLLVAEDNTRWQLNLTVNAVQGNGAGGGANEGFNSLTNGYNQSQSASLNLAIPIDDRAAKQAVVNARIALKEAGIALRQEKWSKETNAINGWNTIYSAERAMHFAEDAEKLQQKTYNISFQKYSFGLIDSLELQTAQQQLIERQQALLAAKISYLKALVTLDQQIGRTLKTWNVQPRYS